MIKSRNGSSHKADLIISPDEQIPESLVKRYKVLMVDEAQFLTVPQVGLLSDYRGHLFPASARFMEVADNVRQLSIPCYSCPAPATMNLRLSREGPQIVVGSDGYKPACFGCWETYMKQNL